MNVAATFNEAERQQHSLLAGIEKRCLIYLASKMPHRVGPDHLTILGFVAQCLAGVLYCLSGENPIWLYGINGLIVLNWFGDSLDGTLARYRQRLRPRYGFYVDHVCDTFGALFLLGGLSFSGYITPALAWGMLIAFYVLSIQVYLATYSMGEFKLSYNIFGPTELRVLLILGNCALFSHSKVRLMGMEFFLFDCGAVCAIFGMLFMAIYASVKNIRALYKIESMD